MNQQAIHDILSGERRGPAWSSLRAVLSVASGPYALAVRCRRWAYRKGFLPSHSAGRPVISVGNITAGGSGKTPMVAWLSGLLTQAGRKPAVLIRGYKGQGGEGDEAKMLREALGQPALVIEGPDRVESAKRAVRQGADVLIMDDGFQHLRLRRDLDIMLIDATNPFGMGRCLPRGLLREPVKAISSADAIVITRSNAVSAQELAALSSRLTELAPNALKAAAVHRPSAVIEDGVARDISILRGKRVFAFCGLGNPRAFFRTLAELGASLAGEAAFADHARYDSLQMEYIMSQAARCNAEALITTAKDAVKIAAANLSMPLWVLQVHMDITSGKDDLTRAVMAALRCAPMPE
jgi:tetraacyldisaccharide 4'-kinase